jgi:hypothetical protein
VNPVLCYLPPSIYLQQEGYLGGERLYYKFGAERSYSEVSR